MLSADFEISTDRSRLDVELIYNFLSMTSYWAKGRSRALVEKSIENSLCFGVSSVLTNRSRLVVS